MRNVLGVVLLTLVACGEKASDPQRVDDILALDGDAVAGADVYDSNCATCHGINGEGGSGPSMSNVANMSESAIVDVVLTGKESMPSFDTLEDQQIADLLEYIVTTY
jgi:mono/diheme cytochrome c family protein